MAHIHKQNDFVVSVFITLRDKVLLIYHKKYSEWLPIGGHIELNEDPDQALYREIREECGLKVRILATRPKIGHKGVKPLLTPSYVDCHRISRTHKHIAFVYFAVAQSDNVKLHVQEHREFRWLSREDLHKSEFKLTKSIRFYCAQALAMSKKVCL